MTSVAAADENCFRPPFIDAQHCDLFHDLVRLQLDSRVCVKLIVILLLLLSLCLLFS